MQTIIARGKPAQVEPANKVSSAAGRASFAVCAAILACLVLALLDRVGAPERLIAALACALALSGIVAIGAAMRTMRLEQFFAAGWALRAWHGAMALTGVTLALAAAFAPPRGPGPAWIDLGFAFIVAFAVSTLIVSRFICRSRPFSLSGWLTARFPAVGVRLLVALAAAAGAALVGLAGLENAVTLASQWLGLSRPMAAGGAALVLFALCGPGGMGGVLWGASGAFGLALLALVAPLIGQIATSGAVPLPIIGDREAMLAGLAQLAALEGAAWPHSWATVLVLGAGLALLAPMSGVFVGAQGAATARRMGFIGLAWSGLLGAMALVVAILTIAGLGATGEGRAPEQLPDAVYAASARGNVLICGARAARPLAAQTACGLGRRLTSGDVTPAASGLLLGDGLVRPVSAAQAALMAAALLTLGLTLAAAGVLGFAATLCNDIFRPRGGQTSSWLAMTRVLAIAAGVAATFYVGQHPIVAGDFICLAAIAMAACLGPLLVLSAWPLASSRDAFLAVAAGATMVWSDWNASTSIFPPSETLVLLALRAGGVALAAGLAASLIHRGHWRSLIKTDSANRA